MRISRNQLRKIISEAMLTSGKVLSESKWSRLATTDEQEFAIQEVEGWMRQMGRSFTSGERMPEVSPPCTVILDLTYNGSEIYVSPDGEISVHGDVVVSYQEFAAAIQAIQPRPVASYV